MSHHRRLRLNIPSPQAASCRADTGDAPRPHGHRILPASPGRTPIPHRPRVPPAPNELPTAPPHWRVSLFEQPHTPPFDPAQVGWALFAAATARHHRYLSNFIAGRNLRTSRRVLVALYGTATFLRGQQAALQRALSHRGDAVLAQGFADWRGTVLLGRRLASLSGWCGASALKSAWEGLSRAARWSAAARTKVAGHVAR